MASNNLRVIYQNLLDISTTTLAASSTASSSTITANLLKDFKSSVWRSIGTTATLSVAVANASTIGGVILPFCNLLNDATIQVIGYQNSNWTTPLFDTGDILACPYQTTTPWLGPNLPNGLNTYSYGGGTYARVWVPTNIQASCLSFQVVIKNPSGTYIEAARLIMGSYWSPTYNTSYGLSSSIKDLSTHERNEAGDLTTSRGILYNSLNFDLKWLTNTDRTALMRILRGNGISRPLLISLFPDNMLDWEKEYHHQVYGKLSQLSGVSLDLPDMYSSTISFEEI
jgi:hypothetical protein